MGRIKELNSAVIVNEEFVEHIVTNKEFVTDVINEEEFIVVSLANLEDFLYDVCEGEKSLELKCEDGRIFAEVTAGAVTENEELEMNVDQVIVQLMFARNWLEIKERIKEL